MTILVTGGCGYIGSHVAWALADAGRPVAILDDLSTGFLNNAPPTALVEIGDVGDEEFLKSVFAKYPVRAVIHMAGKILPNESMHDPLTYLIENCSKSFVLLRSMLANGIDKFVFSSTAAVYGECSAVPVTERSPTSPISPYGLSKLIVEQALDAASAAHALSAVALRYFNVAGADLQRRCGPRGCNPGHLIRTAVDVALSRKPLLEIYGNDYDTPDGTCVRDYIHVSDLARAHLVALDTLDGQSSFRVFNCGYGRGASVLDVIRAVEQASGHPLPYRVGPRRAGDAAAVVADCSALMKLGTWAPQHADLSTIVQSMIEWERGMGADRVADCSRGNG